jgi:hypothetical protein
MMTLLLALLPGAHADDLQPGMALPGATPVDGPSTQVGAGIVCDTGDGCGPMLEGQINVTDRIGLVGDLPWFFTGEETEVGGVVGARMLLIDQPNFRMAPIAVFGTQDELTGSNHKDLAVGAGAAIEIGSEDFSLDAALPVLMVANEDTDFAGRSLGASEVGVNVGTDDFLGLADESQIRAGLSHLDPMVSYRLEGETWYGEAKGAVSTNDGDLSGMVSAGALF